MRTGSSQGAAQELHLTTIRAEGSTDESQDLRQLGHAKEGRTVRQVMLGVVQTAAGLPIHHEVFAGNTGETTTLVPTIDHGSTTPARATKARTATSPSSAAQPSPGSATPTTRAVSAS